MYDSFSTSFLSLISRIVIMVERISFIVAEAIVVALTIHHAVGILRISREANIRVPFTLALLRAGGVICAYNIVFLS